jgi:hypothetical protein
MIRKSDIEIEYDEASKDYFIIWEPPTSIGSGSDQIEALRDLQKAAHFGIDLLIDLKQKDIAGDKE